MIEARGWACWAPGQPAMVMKKRYKKDQASKNKNLEGGQGECTCAKEEPLGGCWAEGEYEKIGRKTRRQVGSI